MLLFVLNLRPLLIFAIFQLCTSLAYAVNGFKPRVIPTDNEYEFPVDVQIDTSGRAVFSYFAYAKSNFFTGHPCVMRLHSDGTVDSTFRNSGKTFLESGFDFGLVRLLVQPDGKSVILGNVNIGEDLDFGLARFNETGELDSSFGNHGIQITDLEINSDDVPVWAELQPDGKIVVAGTIRRDSQLNHIALVRYLSNGTLDGTFGNGGRVTTDVGLGELYVQHLDRLGDGKLRVNSISYKDGTRFSTTVRYLEDGSLDSSFGSGGILVWDAEKPVIDDPGGAPPGEDLLRSQTAYPDTCDVRRYRSNGSPDFSFGSFGVATVNFNCSAEHSLLLLPNRKIVVAGTHANADGKTITMLARLNLDGTLDDTFGVAGYVTIEFPGVDTNVSALARSGDNVIVVGFVRGQMIQSFVASVDEKGSLGRSVK